MDPTTRFALAGLGSAATAANAVRPMALEGPLSVPAFALGFVPSELPIPTAAVHLAIGGVLTRGTRRRSWRAGLGVASFAAAAVGFGLAHRSATRAEAVFDEALREGLGDARIDPRFVAEPAPAITRLRIAIPSGGRPRRRYRSDADISYGDAGKRNQLDIWKRPDLPTDAGAPVLVQAHGGGWTTGRKEGQAEPLMAHLAERGWVCVTLNYRLSPTASWPDQIIDVKRAIAWTKANIAQFGGDPDFIAVTGGSAGGQLAALAALTPNLESFQPGFEDVDTSVSAAVPIYGVYDFLNVTGVARTDMQRYLGRKVFKVQPDEDRALWEQASPISHVSADAPPFFVIHGSNDTLAPAAPARAFADQLRSVSQRPVVYAELPGAQHAFDVFPSVRTRATVNAVDRFLAFARTEHQSATLGHP